MRDDPMVKLIQKFGYMRVQRATNFVAAWAYAEAKLGYPPRMADYIRFWEANHSTAYREQADFRAITGLDTPAPLVEALREAGVGFKRKPSAADAAVVLPLLAQGVV